MRILSCRGRFLPLSALTASQTRLPHRNSVIILTPPAFGMGKGSSCSEICGTTHLISKGSSFLRDTSCNSCLLTASIRGLEPLKRTCIRATQRLLSSRSRLICGRKGPFMAAREQSRAACQRLQIPVESSFSSSKEGALPRVCVCVCVGGQRRQHTETAVASGLHRRSSNHEQRLHETQCR